METIVLNQSHTGGASRTIHYNEWLATVPNEPSFSGAKNSSVVSYIDEAGFEDIEEDDSLRWAADNLGYLTEKHPNQWILVRNRCVLMTADDVGDLLVKASRAGFKKPLVLKMEEKPERNWRTAF
jgi:hypothetical protein